LAANSIEIEGFEELEAMLQGMTITEADERKAMQKAIEPIYNEVDANAPERTGNLRKQIKKQVLKDGFATVGVIKLGSWYSLFNEFGTSKSKKHVGFFARAVNKTKDEAVSILAKELLDKAK
jgi:phage protein, HK97 gp10 family